MKTLNMLVAIVILFTANIFAQSSTVDVLYLKNGSIIRGQVTELDLVNVKIKTADGSLFVYPMTEVEKMVKEPITILVPPAVVKVEKPTPTAPKPKKEGISFGLRFGLFSSIQIWDQRADKSANGVGFGLMGNITAGINIDDDMYVGVGPHFGGSFLTQTVEVSGYTGSGSWSVIDVGGNLLFGFDEMYFILGLGSADVSVTATYSGESETVEMPESASYKRVGFGWGKGFAFGISYVSYSDWAKNLSRFEINMGYKF